MPALAAVWRHHRDAGERRVLDRLLGAMADRRPPADAEVGRVWSRHLPGGLSLGLAGLAEADLAADGGGYRASAVDAGGARHLLFDGRLDNRDELIAELGTGEPAGAGSLSPALPADAELVLRALGRWGTGGLGRLLGPFALVLYGGRDHELVLARGAFGDRPLFYAPVAEGIAAASEVGALLRHPRVSPRPDETSQLAYLASGAPRRGRTFFQQVREVPPGTFLVFRPGRPSPVPVPYPLPEAGPRLSLGSDDAYAERFREVLAAAVGCRLPGRVPGGRVPGGGVSVLMSGGLDSTAVAALAAGACSGPATAISWTFASIPEADETSWIRDAVRHLGLHGVEIAGEDAWPLQAAAAARAAPPAAGPTAPFRPAYPLLLDRAYSAARDRGAPILLTGDFGDHLYAGADIWLRDLLAVGRLAAAARRLAAERRYARAGGGLGVRAALRALLPSRTRPPRPAWLRPEAAREWARLEGLQAAGRRADDAEAGAGRAGRLRALIAHPAGVSPLIAEDARAARMGVEIRRPYRDRRLVDLVSRVPADQLYRPGWLKWVLRRAMRDLLPESVRLRRRPTSLMPLFSRGLLERESALVRRLLGAEARCWPRFVRRDWAESVYPGKIAAQQDGLDAAVLWRCLSLELWSRCLEGALDEGGTVGRCRIRMHTKETSYEKYA